MYVSRRDGSPFLNLLMVAPLQDSRGILRYFIGAQVDVSGLAKECTNLEGLQRLLQSTGELDGYEPDEKKDEFQALSEMFNLGELESARKHGGRMHRELQDGDDGASIRQRPRLLLKDHSTALPDRQPASSSTPTYGRLSGVYQNVSAQPASCSTRRFLTWHSLCSCAPTHLCASSSSLPRCACQAYCNHHSWIELAAVSVSAKSWLRRSQTVAV